MPFALSRPELDVKLDRGPLPRPTDLFKHPFVVDVMGAGFDKPANTRYFASRFPRVQKILQDHTFIYKYINIYKYIYISSIINNIIVKIY